MKINHANSSCWRKFAEPKLKSFSKSLQKHITRGVNDGAYDTKTLLGAAIALDVFSNGVDYLQIKHNDNLKKNDKHYLEAYKLTNGLVEGVVQLVAGSIILNKKTQDFLIKFSKKHTGMPVNPSKTVKNNFRILTTLFGSAILAKRIIAPLIVTPLTTFVRKNADFN